MCAKKEIGQTKLDELIEKLDRLTTAVERLVEVEAARRSDAPKVHIDLAGIMSRGSLDRAMGDRFGVRPVPKPR
jgi:hypothetical protein